LSDQKKFWVGFNLVKGIGAARLRMLLNFFEDIETAWTAPAGQLRDAGLSQKIVDALIQVRMDNSLEKIWRQILDKGIQVITWEDDEYPRRLKEIGQPPPVLYVRGEVGVNDEWSIAVVGTRRITAYGRQVTEEIAGALASSGLTVISGLARGVDSIAHKAALNAGGRTIAVLGSGVDIVYPNEHRALAERIITQGALISDYPPGTPPEGINFPPRNRIISGLSLGVIVVEAGEKSGALITAEFAADQGRDVFAVPGPVYAPQSAGCNRLIQQGAYMLLKPRDVLESLDLNLVVEKRAARSALPANQTEAQLMSYLSQQPMHVDEIQARTNLPVENVTASLTMMELKGMVKQVGGMRYVAVRELPGSYETMREDRSS